MKDPTAHAEILCIRAAAEIEGSWRLVNYTLYTTLEPCPMCMGAIQQSRIKTLVYGAKDFRLGAAGSWIDLVHKNKHPFHDMNVVGGVLEDESSSLLKRFFLIRRREDDFDDSNKISTWQIDRGFCYKSVLDGN
jgi:tRNA(adenine34) deaminase